MSKINDYLKEAGNTARKPAPDSIVETLTQILADTTVFWFKSHSFHWNVVGSNFPQYHEFFGDIYVQVFANIDRIAEEIRALDSMAPKNLAGLIAQSSLTENKNDLTAIEMITELASDNQKILGALLGCQKMAEAANQVGLSNYLQDLFDAHKKLAWMLNSTLKG